MGGKTKQNQRTKNNAKPSNSGRSAELLGTSAPSFVGFSAHSDLGMIPFVPGFATTENLPDTFDSSVGTQFQLVLRKMSKKDPITKVKALQEFMDVLRDSEVDVVKGILPLWPKFYHNLANDVDYRVRESAQNVQELIVTKCKKAVAPYLKQLTPVWLGSQFDNYPPAASVAVASFQSVFAANKMQEVCLFCQQEIMDYTVRNLTFHTASTLSSAKSCTPEEAEQKYQRIVVSSLKILSFYLEKTAGDISQSVEKFHNLLSNQKFWSFSKHRTPHIRSSWFEFIYNVLQYAPETTEGVKNQLISICFQNIDDSDSLIAPQIWGCILLLQNTYDDWYKSLNFKKNILPKLSTFLQNSCNGCAEAVCPNLLPFLSRLTQESLQVVNLDEFYKDFFNDLKAAIKSPKTSKSSYSSLTAAYYECVRFILQRLNANTLEKDETQQLQRYIIDELINEPITNALLNNIPARKYIFLHTSALVAYCSSNSTSELYAGLLIGFWSSIMEIAGKTPLSTEYLDNIINLINNLYTANPNLKSHKVKFATIDEGDSCSGVDRQKSKNSATYIQTDLRKLVVLLVQLCLNSISEEKVLNYETEMVSLIKLYGDAEFYAQVSGKNDMEETLKLLIALLCESTSPPSDVIIEIVFDLLNYLEKDKKLQIINKILQTNKSDLQQCILQRVLSYPMCVEPEVRLMLSQDHVVQIILQTASEVLIDDSKEKFNLLHKCFFQTDSGEILINKKTVDGILDIISKPLTSPGNYDSMMDPCGSFIAQIMPVVCSNNSTKEAINEIFLKLFKFTVEQTVSDDLSQDTLWEISTCWQDALSSEDIVMDIILLQKCSEIISNRLSTLNSPRDIDNIIDIVAKLILCSIENIQDEEKLHESIDSYSREIFKPAREDFNRTYERVSKFCIFLEVMNDRVAVSELPDDACKNVDIDMFFRRSLLNLTSLMKMVCCSKVKQLLGNLDKRDDEDNSDDYIDPNEIPFKNWTEELYNLILELVKIGAMAEAIASIHTKISDEQITLMLEISEKVKLLLQNLEEEYVMQIKDRLFKDAAFNDIAATRALQYLVVIPQYAIFEESALLVMHEELADYFISRESVSSYVNLVQFIEKKLTPGSINLNNPIFQRNADSWQKCSMLRHLIANNLNEETSKISDKKIVEYTLSFITEISENQKQTNKEQLLFNTVVTKQNYVAVTRIVQYINLLIEVIKRFPNELSIKHWDAIRIGLSSWVLTVAKSVENYKCSKIPPFVAAVFSLHSTVSEFIRDEKTKSSYHDLKPLVDEWENLFSDEINLVLFKSFYACALVKKSDDYSTSYESMFESILIALRCMDYSIIYKFCKAGSLFSLDDITNYFLDNISAHLHNLRITSMFVIERFVEYFIASDKEAFEKTADIVDANPAENNSQDDWHFLGRLRKYIEKYETSILKYLEEFSYKLSELPEMQPIERGEALTYLSLWSCILHVCSEAPIELRSVYTSWLTENKFDQKFLSFLFRAMPIEILKNHDSKFMSNELFKGLTPEQINSSELKVDKYVCHLYKTTLSKLPAVVRKWWNSSHSRQKVFVDKLTTNFVSGIICQEELDAIAGIDMNNMQVTVHTSTREVNAVYFIDEARMELVITLASNYPLGGVKVESGKQIGGRTSSRNIAMQLTIFLTHQNGSIFDGLSLWKRNLDKKFEGVEECYVCYTVIHQDTCQLPKLTCKTCRKKFHSPCLYKWFTTSSKSTCPICRNIF